MALATAFNSVPTSFWQFFFASFGPGSRSKHRNCGMGQLGNWAIGQLGEDGIWKGLPMPHGHPFSPPPRPTHPLCHGQNSAQNTTKTTTSPSQNFWGPSTNRQRTHAQQNRCSHLGTPQPSSPIAMENQFHSVETWQGHVLVSASLLPPSVEEKERIYPDRSTYTRSSPQLPLMNRRHGLHMAASLPPVPDYWNHEHRGQVEPVVDATCGSHLWPTPPMMNVIPSR